MTHYITLFLLSIGVFFTNPFVEKPGQKNSDVIKIANTTTSNTEDGGTKNWDDE